MRALDAAEAGQPVKLNGQPKASGVPLWRARSER